ncbi:MAG: M15 family metallopeptidase [bacterium]|nr:M15 family metallopeptidase [bacterium]
MNFRPDSIHTPEESNFGSVPIEGVSPELRQKFQNKDWERVPITEPATTTPKSLEVVPNTPVRGQAMAWPAYYKTVTEGLENDGRAKGVGELAQMIEGSIQSSPIVKVRAELKSKLDKAQKILDSNPTTQNLQLVVVDGYRRIDVQKRLFDAYLGYVNSQHPELSEAESRDMARKMVSEPPSDLNVLRESPPPHSTGGSIDVVLVFKDKINIRSDYWVEEAMVPFGAKFDEMMNPVFRDERSETIFYEKKAELSSEEQEALEHRRILYHILTRVGLTNYFNEFWHYDFGNQFDALSAGKQEAQFGFAGGINEGRIIEDLSAEKEAFNAYSATVGTTEAEKVRHHFGL